MPRSTSGATPMQSGPDLEAHPHEVHRPDEVRTLKARAREAAARADWPDAYAALKALDSSTFAPVDIDLFADAAWWTSRLDESIALRQRAYAAFAASDDELRAASAAWFLWFDHRFKGDLAIASGWLTRAGPSRRPCPGEPGSRLRHCLPRPRSRAAAASSRSRVNAPKKRSSTAAGSGTRTSSRSR